MKTAHYTLAALLPAVAVALSGCESADSGSGAYWNSQAAATGQTTPATTTAAAATTTTSAEPTTGTAATAVAVDEIPAGSIRYLHADVSGWPITSAVRVSIGGGKVNMNYDKAKVWPVRDGVNANCWVIVNLNGQWTAATFDWMRQGQTSKSMEYVSGGNIKKEPLNDFRPVSGETYGWMVSTLARSSTRTTNERTNIVLAKWP